MFLTNFGQGFEVLDFRSMTASTNMSSATIPVKMAEICNEHINRSFILDVFWGKGGSSVFVFGLLPALTIGG